MVRGDCQAMNHPLPLLGKEGSKKGIIGWIDQREVLSTYVPLLTKEG